MSDRLPWWLDALHAAPLHVVAEELGLRPGRGRSWSPCPACDADDRGGEDKRGTVGTTTDGNGWRCHRCQAGGDALDLVSVCLCGVRFRGSTGVQKDEVRGWYVARAWAEPDRGAPPATERPSPKPERPERPEPAVAPPKRPPPAELAKLWAASWIIGAPEGPPWGDPADPHALDDDDLDAVGFLAKRGYWPAADLAGLCRILPPPRRFRTWPSWWPQGWTRTYRIAVLGYEADGTPASLHARAITEDARPKTRWPRGAEAGGLLMADARGLAVLRGEAAPGTRVLVVEGLTGLLFQSLTQGRAENPAAVLSSTSGGFRALARVRWPEGAEVFAATDDDETGEKYAREIRAAVPASIRVRRVRWHNSKGGD